MIKSFWSLYPECLKERKQLLVSNGVRCSYHTLLLEKSCHRAREMSGFIGPHRTLLLRPLAHDPTSCGMDREQKVPEWIAVQATLAVRERDSKYTTMYITPIPSYESSQSVVAGCSSLLLNDNEKNDIPLYQAAPLSPSHRLATRDGRQTARTTPRVSPLSVGKCFCSLPA